MMCRVNPWQTTNVALAFVFVAMFLATGPSVLGGARTAEISGKVMDPQGLAMPSALITLTNAESSGVQEMETDGQGVFMFRVVTAGKYTITAQAGAFKTIRRTIDVNADGTTLVEMRFGQIASVHDSVVIVSATEDPALDLRNGDIFKKTLFERDDQMLESLGAGINAGQHEGGGKSLEVRRFGSTWIMAG
jgi:Carboxypeptidase regulatory-like domain